MIDLNPSLLADVETPLVTRRTRIRDLIDRLLYTTIGAQREALIEQLRHEVDEIRKLIGVPPDRRRAASVLPCDRKVDQQQSLSRVNVRLALGRTDE